MENKIFRGRQFSEEEIGIIKEIIKKHWSEGRRNIAREVCKRIGWYSINGKLKIISCLEALRRMERLGLLCLPKPKSSGG